MNDDHLPDDDVLRLVFGELDAERQAAVRKAVAEDAELAATARGLEAAVVAVRAENVGQVSDDFNDRLRRRMPDIFDCTQAESTRPTFLTRSLDTWRWIMRSPVSRVAAAAIFVLAVAGVAVWFHGSGATPAFADFLEPILEAKTVRYKVTTEMKGPPATNLTTVVMMLDATRSRSEMEVEMPDQSKFMTVEIRDGGLGKTLMLQPAEKRATVYNDANMPEDRKAKPDDPFWFRSLLLDARDKPDVKREPLGEKDIDGRRVVGIRLSLPAAVFSVWGDPKTGLPVRIEATVAIMPNVKMKMSDFAFNVDMDESLFSVEPPAGYEVIQVQRPPSDGSPSEEKDLIEMFRCYGEWCGGLFPDLLDWWSIDQMVRGVDFANRSPDEPPKPRAEREQEWSEAQSKLQGGLQFAVGLPPEADWHYAGRGVSLGAADTPIFWYRPKDAKAYRVIYADLSIRDAETPPSVPVAEPGQPEQDLIEMFRQYSELSGGPFPRSLDMMSILHVFMVKKGTSDSLESPHDPSAKQEREQEIVEAQAKLQRGLRFASLLPKEANSHYAGKGVSLGAADMPIFWYRPKDSKKYRVIYADLSVRDAEGPPSEPVAQPEQDLIDTFRYYSELSGGPFPDLLVMESLLQMVMIKKCSFESLEQLRKPNAKQVQEYIETVLKLQPGSTFVGSLPPEADAHYAGKGIALGAADTPIFWYRPKDGKQYRVIYADLSVREAETPPSVPDAQPVPAPSSPKK